MNGPNRRRDIVRRLRDTPAGEPPAGLLGRLRADVPPDLAERLGAERDEPAPPARTLRWMPAAAALVMLLGGGFLVWRVFDGMPPVERARDEGAVLREIGTAGDEGAGGEIVPADVESGSEAVVLEGGAGVETPRLEGTAAGRPGSPPPEPGSAALLPLEGERKAPARTASQPQVDTAEAKIRVGAAAEAAPPPPVVPEAEIRAERAEPPPTVEGEASPRRMVVAAQAAPEAKRVPSGDPTPARSRPSAAASPRAQDQGPAAGRLPSPPAAGLVPEPVDPRFVETASDRLSTFGLDVGTGSYALVRGLLERGQAPPPAAVRLEEIVNHFDPGDPEPPPGETFGVVADGGPSPFHDDPRYRLLRFAVRARRARPAERAVAEKAWAQVEIEPRAVLRWRLLGYENQAIADERFQFESEGAGAIGPGRSVTALYEVELAEPAPRGTLARLELRWRDPTTGRFRETERRLHAADVAPTWEAASPAFRLAATAAAFAEALRGSPWARPGLLAEVARRVERLEAESDGRPEVGELARLVRRAEEVRSDDPP